MEKSFLLKAHHMFVKMRKRTMVEEDTSFVLFDIYDLYYLNNGRLGNIHISYVIYFFCENFILHVLLNKLAFFNLNLRVRNGLHCI